MKLFLLGSTVLVTILQHVCGDRYECDISTRLRDKWDFVEGSRKSFIRIRKNSLLVKEPGEKKIRYKCIESSGNTYLLRKRIKKKKRDGILCIGFAYIADHPQAEYSVVRLNPQVRRSLFSPQIIDRTRRQRLSLKNVCRLRGGDRTNQAFIRRSLPGCKFPKSLRKMWNYTYHQARSLTIDSRSMKLLLLNGQQYIFRCERRDGNIYVLRVKHFASGRDGIMCLQISGMKDDLFYNYELARLNSGEELDGQLMLVPSGKPVYMHEDCDWIDSPARPEFIYI